MYKIIFNSGEAYKTPFNCKNDCKNNINPDLLKYIKSDEFFLINIYPFTQVKIDGRKKENRKLKFFSWYLIKTFK